MNRENIEKIASTPEDKMLLAKLWDKIQTGIRRNIPVNTCFLTLHEQEMSRYLFGQQGGLFWFGGYENAERKMLCYLPEYCNYECLYDEDSPVVCLRASFYQGASPNHRDFLGALIGCGLSRDVIGDICISQGSCDFFVTQEIAPFILQNFSSAGRVKVSITQIPLCSAIIPAPEFKEIRDTLASIRLDAVIASGFRIGRSLSAQYITSGKSAVDGLPCEKSDKAISEGSIISVRGLGKIKLQSVNGQTKKGRISVVIHRYI